MEQRKQRILVVEDEAAIRIGLADVLVFHGFDVDAVADGKDGLAKALSGRYDLLLLDVMLPGRDGFSICDEVRKVDRAQPIIMLTAKTSDEDIVNGLTLGADDYVAKPFAIAQLVLRVKAVLRRSRVGVESAARIALDGVDIDTQNLSGRRGAETLAFTRREIEILQYLGANVPQAWAAGSVFHMLRAILGADADAQKKTLSINPTLPRWLSDITVRNLRVGDATIDIHFWREGETTRHDVLAINGELNVERLLPTGEL